MNILDHSGTREYPRVPSSRNSPLKKGARGIFLLLLLAFQTSAQTATSQPYTLDTTFYPTFNYNNYFNIIGYLFQVYEEPNGDILTIGEMEDAFFNPAGPADMVRLHHDGQHDTTFLHSSNQQLDPWSTRFIGKLNNEYWIGRFNNIRSLDMSGSYVHQDYTDTLIAESAYRHFGSPLLLRDGRMVMGAYGGFGKNGWPYPPSNPTDTLQIVRILPNGKVDTSFRHSVNLDNIGRIMAYDSSHWLVEANPYVTTYDGHSVVYGQYSSRLFRTDTSGNFDTTFAIPPFINGGVGVFAVQSDGKVIIYSDNFGFDLPGRTGCRIARLHGDGSVDTAFNIMYIDPTKNYYYDAICETSDGGLLLGGRFDTIQGRPRRCLALLDHNGYLDTTVFNGSGMDSTKNYVPGDYHKQPAVFGITRSTLSDEYYVYGFFNRYNGVSVQPIIRLHGPNYLSTGIGANVESERLDIGLYPNPAKEEVSLRLGLYNGNGIRYTIHDMLGRPVLNGQVQGMETRIPLHGLSEGLYIVSVSDGKRVLGREKLMVR